MTRAPIRRHVSDTEAPNMDDLTTDQAFWLKLGLTLGGPPFPFDSMDEAEREWRRHRRLLMDRQDHHGHRPHGFWLFELGEEPPTRQLSLTERLQWPWPWDAAARRLAELGELTAEELEHLRARERPEEVFNWVLRLDRFWRRRLSKEDIEALREFGRQHGREEDVRDRLAFEREMLRTDA